MRTSARIPGRLTWCARASLLLGLALAPVACASLTGNPERLDQSAAGPPRDGGSAETGGADFAASPRPATDLGRAATDLGRAAPDLSPIGCTPACGANQICQKGTCQTLPGSCPCPRGAYCDLAANTCKPGCLADTDCDNGFYCDSSRMCTPGCRGDNDCPDPADLCLAHACGHPDCVNGCDDGNVCTSDSCVGDQCEHVDANESGACPDDGNPCTSDVCVSGGCKHSALANNTACPDDGNVCTSDVCSAGRCTHPNLPDATACASSDSAFCVAGTCTTAKAYCYCYGSNCEFQGNQAGSCACDNTANPPELIGSGTSFVTCKLCFEESAHPEGIDTFVCL